MLMSEKRQVSLRRNLEQAKHCLEEALSIVEQNEDMNCALDDVEQAAQLLREAIVPKLKIAAGLRDR